MNAGDGKLSTSSYLGDIKTDTFNILLLILELVTAILLLGANKKY